MFTAKLWMYQYDIYSYDLIAQVTLHVQGILTTKANL